MPRFALALVLLLAALPAFAVEPLVKPLPKPDLSKLPPEQAAQLTRDRAEFEKTTLDLMGGPLATAFALIGVEYAHAGFFDIADIAFHDAAALEPQDGRWVYLQGANAMAQKQSERARAYYERSLALLPDYLPTTLALVRLDLGANDPAAAQKRIDAYLVRHTDQPAGYALRADLALRQKRYAEAVTAAEQALKLEPQATRTYAVLADAYQGAGNARAAADARAKAGPTPPFVADPLAQGIFDVGKTGAPRAADPFARDLAAASGYFAARDYAKARSSLDDALRKKPGEPTALALYARIDAAAGDLAAARSHAAAALKASPNGALANLSEGIVLEMSNDEVGAQNAYRKAIVAQPALAEPYLLLGNQYMRGKRYAEAAAQYLKLTELEPDNGENWARLVAAEAIDGKCARALKDINDALSGRSDWGYALQLFVRTASTCPAASAEERRMALDYGAKLYKASNAPAIGEAYALALAAGGKWDDATKTQAAAMFDLVASNRRIALTIYREFFQDFQARRLPATPWPSVHPLFHPGPPAASPVPPPAPAKR